MICPKCAAGELSSGLGASGNLIDRCGVCGGVWLDKGEWSVYFKDASKFEQALAEALAAAKPSTRRCPRCEQEMRAASLAKADTELDSCPKCAGLWLDQGEFAALKKTFG